MGHAEPMLRPRESNRLDYEGEIALIIGKPGRRIPKKQALEHVAGFSCYNDGSVRDFQRHTTQFTPGKNFVATGGFGPWMMTPDEIGDLDDMEITTRLNGEVMQNAKAALLDLRLRRADRVLLDVHAARARRRDRHRHAGRRRRGAQSAALHEGRRRRRGGSEADRRAAQPASKPG